MAMDWLDGSSRFEPRNTLTKARTGPRQAQAPPPQMNVILGREYLLYCTPVKLGFRALQRKNKHDIFASLFFFFFHVFGFPTALAVA